MDELLKKTLLYDFYGELLTPHQKRIYESIVFDDMSLGELAAEEEISRQAVFDMNKRSYKLLCDYEEKLHLVEKFMVNRSSAEQIQKVAGTLLDEFSGEENGVVPDRETVCEKLNEILGHSQKILNEM